MFESTPIWPDSLLVNFSYEFGQIMTSYDFLDSGAAKKKTLHFWVEA